MELKRQIIEALEALAPFVDSSKGLLEYESSAVAISMILSKPYGINLTEYISDTLQCGKKPLFSINEFVEKNEIDKFVLHCYKENKKDVLKVLLPLYAQLWLFCDKEQINTRAYFEALRNLENSKAVKSKKFQLSICLKCYSTESDQNQQSCRRCSKGKLLQIFKLSLSQRAREALRNNQHLEIYVKECLRDSGVELIGWNIPGHNKKAYTSIRYQVEGINVEPDVHGFSKPLALLLCEVKTAKKITINDIKLLDSGYDNLMKQLNAYLGNKQLKCLKVFIITGKFDENIPFRPYIKKDWIFWDRSKILNLTEEFREIVKQI